MHTGIEKWRLFAQKLRQYAEAKRVAYFAWGWYNYPKEVERE